MVSPETHYGRLTKDTVWGTAISPVSIVMECQQLSVSLRCFVHKATSAEPLKSGTRTSAVVYVGPPRESWRQTRPQPAFISTCPRFQGQTCPSCGGTCSPLGCPVGAEFTKLVTDCPAVCEGGSDSPLLPKPHDPWGSALTSAPPWHVGNLRVFVHWQSLQRWH